MFVRFHPPAKSRGLPADKVKRKNRKTVLNIMKIAKTSKPGKELCSLIREVG